MLKNLRLDLENINGHKELIILKYVQCNMDAKNPGKKSTTGRDDEEEEMQGKGEEGQMCGR